MFYYFLYGFEGIHLLVAFAISGIYANLIAVATGKELKIAN